MYVKLFVALVKGDDAEATAIRNQKSSAAALKSEVSLLEGTKVDLERKVEIAKENSEKAFLNNGKSEFDRVEYITGVKNAYYNEKVAEKALKQNVEETALLQALYERTQAPVA